VVTLAVEVEDEDQVYESSIGDKVEGDGDGVETKFMHMCVHGNLMIRKCILQ